MDTLPTQHKYIGICHDQTPKGPLKYVLQGGSDKLNAFFIGRWGDHTAVFIKRWYLFKSSVH